jgi:hypothetical protein
MPVPRAISALVVLATIVACRDTAAPTTPDLSLATSRSESGGSVKTIKLMDACDPETFGEVGIDCQRNGGVTLDKFIEQLTRLQRAPAWKFTPGELHLKLGDEFMGTNKGGEVHTFTEVEEFGGGIVPDLNDLAGFDTVAPECTVLTDADFLAVGSSSPIDEAEEVGDELYQCCIHPWMQATVHVSGK